MITPSRGELSGSRSGHLIKDKGVFFVDSGTAAPSATAASAPAGRAATST